MKNKLGDLNDHLFAALERLADEDLTAEQIDAEVKRSGAIVSVADKIVGNARLQLDAAKLYAEHGQTVMPMLPEDWEDGMKGQSIPYLPQELAWIEARKEMPRAELHALFCAYWQRDDVSPENFKALCTRRGWKTGRTGCFEKGPVPHNKGKRHTGAHHPNSRKTQFKKGDVSANVVPLWTERIAKDGYVEIKVPERNPHTGHSTRFVEKHVWLWERENGRVPEGHALKCLDGNKQNTDPSNWTPVPRAVLPRLAGAETGIHYDTAADELKPTLLAIAKLEHAARERRKESA